MNSNREIHEPTNPYSEKCFDEGYYGGSIRGGFGPEIKWDNPMQQSELQKKFDCVSAGGSYESILFVGCALGNEVRYFRELGKNATGVEISSYAVEHCHASVSGHVRLYDGWDLGHLDNLGVDVVASFDVLTLLPDDMLLKLIGEMHRAAADRIVFRTIVDCKCNLNEQWAGNDGVTFRYLTWDKWRDLFSKNDFMLVSSPMDYKGEIVFTFQRQKATS
jgi:predicted TPR repeat methyltransferase